MRVSRIVVKNFRCFEIIDVAVENVVTFVIGENNTGKSNLFQALRLCIDVSLPSSYRSLGRDDIHSGIDIGKPSQVLVGVEITGFRGNLNEEALVHGWQMTPDLARLMYRFRPSERVREAIAEADEQPTNLTLDDYRWEILAGGDPAIDLPDIEWDTEVGSGIRFADLQSFLVVNLPALRDVEYELRQARTSPLARLIEASAIGADEQAALVAILEAANNQIRESPTIKAIGESIDSSFKEVTGPAFSMDVALGLEDPTFKAIIRALKILLTNVSLKNFDPSRNGLGLNNILYVSMWIEYFHKRLAQQKSAGQILLVEEPEAHLHPQLQITLVAALRALPFQSILTTHSTHITAQANLSSFIALTHTGLPATSASVVASNPSLAADDIHDLERYLDATKSSLLFARKVMLLEGPAELFLIPALLKKVQDLDLERIGISPVAIYGVHFDVYAKLFRQDCLPKKCAIVADADLTPSDATVPDDGDEEGPIRPDLAKLEGPFVKTFLGATTFERELTEVANLPMLEAALRELGAPIIAGRVQAGREALAAGNLGPAEASALLNEMKDTVLSQAKRFGKARFAQVVARHVTAASVVPTYILNAVAWLNQP